MPAHQYSVTKTIAHESVSGDKKARQKARIMTLFVSPGVTLANFEIADRTGIKESTVCARRNELVADGHLAKRGQRRNPETGGLTATVGLPVNA